MLVIDGREIDKLVKSSVATGKECTCLCGIAHSLPVNSFSRLEEVFGRCFDPVNIFSHRNKLIFVGVT